MNPAARSTARWRTDSRAAHTSPSTTATRGTVSRDPIRARKLPAALSRSWSITDRPDWEKAMQDLLAGRNIGGDGEVVLAIRMTARQQWGVESISMSQWLDCITQWCRTSGHSAEVEKQCRSIAQRVGRYESRFRADGLIPPEGFVTSMLAYDYGRAVNMARWGFLAEYCGSVVAEQCILRASTLARAKYVSWQEFSASYILGRVIRLDDDGYNSYYQRVFDGHRILTGHPDSPWRHMQF
ncbi:DUF1266 domain-containing protein [Rhodococcus spelaei]|nr:DUF1266 domain-containing protein [Rhodococcus spelaei]